jgi:Cu/Ag efflux protein CusF
MTLKKGIPMKSLLKAVFAASLVLSSATGVHAQSAQNSASADDAMSSGEVRKIDKSAGKMTIKHGPLKNLGMDGMTMVFRVKDPDMLDQVKVGDKIRFVAEEPNGQLTVTRLEKQQ